MICVSVGTYQLTDQPVGWLARSEKGGERLRMKYDILWESWIYDRKLFVEIGDKIRRESKKKKIEIGVMMKTAQRDSSSL